MNRRVTAWAGAAILLASILLATWIVVRPTGGYSAQLGGVLDSMSTGDLPPAATRADLFRGYDLTLQQQQSIFRDYCARRLEHLKFTGRRRVKDEVNGSSICSETVITPAGVRLPLAVAILRSPDHPGLQLREMLGAVWTLEAREKLGLTSPPGPRLMLIADIIERERPTLEKMGLKGLILADGSWNTWDQYIAEVRRQGELNSASDQR